MTRQTPLPFEPEGLFLTWQRDPTGTMTIQWLEEGTLLPLLPGQKERVTPFRIPFLGDAGSATLWDSGFAIDFMATSELRVPTEFSAVSRLAWCREGVLIGIAVRQEEFREAEEPSMLWAGDSIEVIIAMPEAKSLQKHLHMAVAPGLDVAHPASRIYFHSHPQKSPPEPEIAILRESSGYRFHIVIPWEAFPEFSPEEGDEFAIQIYVNKGLRPKTRRLVWFPSPSSGSSPKLVHRVVLSNEASPACRASVALDRGEREAVLTLHSICANAGRGIRVRDGNTFLGESRLESVEGENFARARLSLPCPEPGRRWGILDVVLEGGERYEVAPNLHPADFQPPQCVSLGYDEGGDAVAAKQYRETTVIPLNCWPGRFLQRVELTGLAPDTTYYFCPVGRTEQWRFRTLPKRLSRPVRIAFGGDMLHRQEWMEETAKVAMAQTPDFIVIGGDLADANGMPDAISRWQQWFSAIDATLRTTDRQVIPVVVAVGNHDVVRGYCHKHPGFEATDCWRAAIAPEFYELFPFPGQPGYGVLDVGDYLSLIILDSGHTNPIPGVQTEWLERTLRERKSRPHLLPVYHVPAYPSVKKFEGLTEMEVRRNWPPLFDRYGIRIVFEHHNHAYKRTIPIKGGCADPAGTIYFGDGAWGVNVRPVLSVAETWYLEKAVSARHLIMLTLEGAQRHLKVFSAQGELIDEYDASDGNGV